MGANQCQRRLSGLDAPLCHQEDSAWSIDHSLELCLEGEEHMFRDKVMLLNVNVAADRACAVRLLNEGALSCPEGFCVVHAVAKAMYFLLFKPETKFIALDRLGVTEWQLITSAAKRASPDAEFRVTLDKVPGTTLGIRCLQGHGETTCLQIESIMDGLISNWNANRPAQQVRRGDLIVEVNGRRGEVDKIVEECKKTQRLTLVLRRGRMDSIAGIVSDICAEAGSSVSSGCSSDDDSADMANEEYQVTLDRNHGTKLGLKMLRIADTDDLVVESVSGGLAKIWNSANPDLRISRGDRFVEVNGVYDDADAMIEECQKHQVVQLTLRRADLGWTCRRMNS